MDRRAPEYNLSSKDSLDEHASAGLSRCQQTILSGDRHIFTRIGAVLLQREENGKSHIIVYASRFLQLNEK